MIKTPKTAKTTIVRAFHQPHFEPLSVIARTQDVYIAALRSSPTLSNCLAFCMRVFGDFGLVGEIQMK